MGGKLADQLEDQAEDRAESIAQLFDGDIGAVAIVSASVVSAGSLAWMRPPVACPWVWLAWAHHPVAHLLAKLAWIFRSVA